MTEVLLINPPFEQEEESVGKTRSIRKVLNIIQPLGIAYIAAILEKIGVEVKIIDCAIGISFDELYKRILEENPSIIGITSTTPAFIKAKKVASFVRQRLPKAKIIIGGAHMTAMPQEVMQTGLFDIGVIGEGELTIEHLFEYYRNREFEKLNEIHGPLAKKPLFFLSTLDSIWLRS